MLGKLFKHEWKSTYRVGCLMLLIIAVVTFFGWLAFRMPMWQAALNEGNYRISSFDILSVMTLLLYVFMLVGVNYGILIYMGVHFYKTMYTDEGYLTHTLPVTKHKLLVSKILVGGIWYLIVMLGIIVSVFVLAAALFSVALPDITWSEIWRAITENWDEFMEMMKRDIGLDIARWGVTLLVTAIVGPFCSIIILYGAVSIGQLFTKHRVLMAIVSYIGIMVLSMIISSVVQSVSSMKILSGMMQESVVLDRYLNTTSVSGALQNLVLAVILYIVSWLVCEKKLNME